MFLMRTDLASIRAGNVFVQQAMHPRNARQQGQHADSAQVRTVSAQVSVASAQVGSLNAQEALNLSAWQIRKSLRARDLRFFAPEKVCNLSVWPPASPARRGSKGSSELVRWMNCRRTGGASLGLAATESIAGIRLASYCVVRRATFRPCREWTRMAAEREHT